MLTVTTKAQLSPIFGLYPDPKCEAQNLLDAAVAARSNAAVVRRYAEDLQAQRSKWPELADTLELVNDIASVLANDLAEQTRTLEVLHRKVVTLSPPPAEGNAA